MSVRVILVRGNALGVGIAGSYLAQLCAGPQCEVRIAPDQTQSDEGVLGAAVLARPDCHRFHDEIGLPAEQLHTAKSVRPAFGWPSVGPKAEVLIPFSPFGPVHGGAEFHQHWLRARAAGNPHGLDAYSPSYAFEQLADSIGPTAAMKLPVDSGLWINRAAYAKVLLDHAIALGAKTSPNASTQADTVGADIVISCGAGRDQGTVDAANWHEKSVDLTPLCSVPGLEWQGYYNAVRRWLSLAGNLDGSPVEAREFNRLSLAEHERSLDMKALLEEADPMACQRTAVARKRDVFEACGRVTLEDYEVFASHEWLAVFWGKGLRPLRHDRLADAVPMEELQSWLGRLHAQAHSIPQQVAS